MQVLHHSLTPLTLPAKSIKMNATLLSYCVVLFISLFASFSSPSSCRRFWQKVYSCLPRGGFQGTEYVSFGNLGGTASSSPSQMHPQIIHEIGFQGRLKISRSELNEALQIESYDNDGCAVITSPETSRNSQHDLIPFIEAQSTPEVSTIDDSSIHLVDLVAPRLFEVELDCSLIQSRTTKSPKTTTSNSLDPELSNRLRAEPVNAMKDETEEYIMEVALIADADEIGHQFVEVELPTGGKLAYEEEPTFCIIL